MALQDKIDQEIKSAMLAKDSVRLRGLRAIKAAILLAKTEKGPTEVLTEDTEIAVLQKLAKQRRESASVYQQQNRDDLYQIEVEELAVIESFLPAQLSREDIERIVKQVITETGATGPKDMGKVMGPANQKLAGKADGKTISEIAKALLVGG
ncbi:aspartyl-tRNA amidotransferase subunit B [Parapedobacter pyrenivorans]|uniref:Aspartyl-tRNA amidotransferase subunit B n=1 Tax=Parapedobacter pyrenivorans TaxID=1305674 RepID=A0A917I345_9SPHI|nr:GatB/YqeY domain-containing protein [Parapedobacter pyrenivorans]GGH05462.1 aspartyl-tRNA amidotransferase subunit B [Parapedobacter pyrenivorans]